MKEDKFVGCKVCLINNGKIITILRDNISDIPYPNMWDLPGGGRENEETPYETMRREVKEELDINVPKSNVKYIKFYKSLTSLDDKAVFMVCDIDDDLIKNINFKNEGQKYKIVSFKDFLCDKDVIEPLKNLFLEYLNS